MRVLCFDDLKSQKGIPWCRDHVRRLVRSGKFPSPISLSESRIAWNEAEIDAWLEARVADADRSAKSRAAA